jgi:hypothetical protein
MRHVLIVGLLIAFGNTTAPAALRAPQPDISITIAPSQVSGGSATVPVRRAEMYVESPFAGVGAPAPLRGTAVTGLSFGIRAWKEGDKARVVVYAVLNDPRAPGGKTETPISTFVMAPGQSVEVPETEKWGASRVFVKAALR